MLQIVKLLTCKLNNCVGAGSEQTRLTSVRRHLNETLAMKLAAGQWREAERIDKVRSALGESYKMELHRDYAIAHMRPSHWDSDGAYPDLPTGEKAMDLLRTDKGPRCVALV